MSVGRSFAVGRQRGQSLVELALLSPILVLLVLGALDLGRVFYFYAGIANATRVGAAYAITLGGMGSHGFSDKELADFVRNRIIDEAKQYELPGGELTAAGNISFSSTCPDESQANGPAGWPSGSDVTVTVCYDFPLLISGTIANWATNKVDGTVKLSYTSTVRLR